ncbi:MAG: SCO family protein [Flavobacteriia bacterium]|nr:SCO family protein [Flavobacteriia bacterium]
MLKSVSFTLILIFLFSCSNKKEQKKLPYLGQVDVVFNEKTQKEDSVYPKIPDFSFLNHDSVWIYSKTKYQNKIIVADFFFTSCPTICPKMTKQMKRLQKLTKHFENKIQFVSFTINPDFDKPSVLKNYRNKYTINAKNWDFLTGDEEETHQLGIEHFLIFAHKDIESEGGYAHSPAFVLIDKNKYVRGVYVGTDSNEVDKLNKDIQILLNNE